MVSAGCTEPSGGIGRADRSAVGLLPKYRSRKLGILYGAGDVETANAKAPPRSTSLRSLTHSAGCPTQEGVHFAPWATHVLRVRRPDPGQMRRHDSDDTFVMAAPVRVDTMFVPVMSRRYVPLRLILARGSETTHTDPSDPAALVTVAPVIATDRVPRNSRRFLTANPVTG